MSETQTQNETTPSGRNVRSSDLLCGDLLRGPRTISSDGVEEWFDFPRYRVVALHMDGQSAFIEVLNRSGETVGTEKLPLSSNQWEPWMPATHNACSTPKAGCNTGGSDAKSHKKPGPKADSGV